MKVLWHSNAPWCASGYGVQTAHAIELLKHQGHEVAVSCMYGLDGNVLNLGGVLLMPGNSPRDGYGNGMAALNGRLWGADVVVTLLDAWVFDPRPFIAEGQRWVALAPIDHEPAPPRVRKALMDSWQAAAFTQGSLDEMRSWGMEHDPIYLPHTYDPNVYRPLPDDELQAARERFNLPADRFIVGMVAANKGTPPRKSIPQVIEAFAEFLRRPGCGDSLLVLHTEMDQRAQGIDVAACLAFYGVPDDNVRTSDQHRSATPSTMAALFNCLDVLVNPAMGEGFGVPVLEAAACGTPAIVGGWTAMPEVAGPGAWLIDRQEALRLYTLQVSHQYVVTSGSVYDRLVAAHAEKGTEAARSRAESCAVHARAWSMPSVLPAWQSALQRVQERIEGEGAPPAAAPFDGSNVEVL